MRAASSKKYTTMAGVCVVCLEDNEIRRNLNEIAGNNLRIIEKLQKCVVEIEWKIDSYICLLCLEQLENVYKFRELCIKSYLQQQQNKELRENFICYHCNDNFQSKDALIDHIDKQHRTLVVNERSDKNDDITTNSQQHKSRCNTTTIKDQSINICDICGSIFTNKYLLKRHQRNVHATEKRYKCDVCERKFASLVYLNAHKHYHIGERNHICTYCGKGYITTSDLYHHEKIHLNQRSYHCDKCPKSFNTSSDLHKHKICVHLDRTEWKYACDYCQKRFPLKTNLDTHVKTHTGEKNFVCHLCERKCINRSVLKRHIDSHSIVKSFKCTICLQCYKYQKSLDVHLAKIHGIGDVKLQERIKQFLCDLCQKSYFTDDKLQKHLRTTHPPPTCDKACIKPPLKTVLGINTSETM